MRTGAGFDDRSRRLAAGRVDQLAAKLWEVLQHLAARGSIACRVTLY
jgi:hypothetical protein